MMVDIVEARHVRGPRRWVAVWDQDSAGVWWALGLRDTGATSFSAIKSRSRRLWLRKYGTLPTAVEFYILADGGQVTKLW